MRPCRSTWRTSVGNDGALLLLRGGSMPPLPPLLPWKGAFVIPDVFTDIPLGDNQRIWTPAFACYRGTVWQDRIIEQFKARVGYTHFPYNCAGQIYHDDYGYVPDNPIGVRADLIKLLTAGLVPVVAACDDADGGHVNPWPSFSANADLIPIAFPMWEMNGPLGVAERQPDGTYTGRIIDCIANTSAAAPNAKLYLHFTSGHGAPGYPEERESWRFVRDRYGVKGLMSQDNGYDRDPSTGDPVGTAAGLADTAMRLGEEDLENCAFEQSTTPVYHKWAGWDETHQRNYGAELMRLAPNTAGFCDGGR